MNDERTHASFFSGVGGLDLGLERAGWRTVSFSEIDAYASAVLAERWPGVPNLGDILDLRPDGRDGEQPTRDTLAATQDRERSGDRLVASGSANASLWTGGFPCQDLSVAGKRRGMGAGTRSGLAFAFLDLVGQHRPRFVLLENVPGLLSSHGGRDMAALVGALVELGYGVGYRVLDARHFGVPQRRRRVFILGISPGGRAGAERAAEVLSVGSRCRRHPPTGIEAGPGVAAGARSGVDIVGTVPAGLGHHGNGGHSSQAVASGHVIPGVRPSPDAHGMRAPDGLAGWSHDRDGLADTLRVGGRASGAGDSYDNTPWVAYRKATKAHNSDDWERREPTDMTDTLDAEAMGAVQATAILGSATTDDPLLPLGLDSHRYRCCGNGVVADVSYWLGLRLLASLEASAA